jgi:hypothetical protein
LSLREFTLFGKSYGVRVTWGPVLLSELFTYHSTSAGFSNANSVLSLKYF